MTVTNVPTSSFLSSTHPPSYWMTPTESHDFQKLIALLHEALARARDSRQEVRDTPPGQFPIHLLPLEVVQEIFIRCLPRESVRPNVAQAPLLLCRICSSWRSIAINLPELWRSLFFTVSFVPPFRGSTNEDDHRALASERTSFLRKHYASLVKGWFDRAGEHPSLSLQFFFEMHNYSDIPEVNDAHSLISEVLVANAPRFRYLDVGAGHAKYLGEFLTGTHSVMLNHLESLVLRLARLENLTPGWIISFHSSPKLRRVSLLSLTIDWPSLLPWSKLTHLKVTDFISSNTWMMLVRGCIDLQYGVFYIKTDGGPPSGVHPNEHTLSNLTNLRLVFLREYDGQIFSGLHLPSLKTLELHSLIGPSQYTNSLPSHLHRFLPSLETFSLISIAIPTGDLLDLLQVSLKLVNLEFASTRSIDHDLLFKRLSYVGTSNPDSDVKVLLPKLEKLAFHVPSAVEEPDREATVFPTHAFVEMVRSRWNTEPLFTSTTTTGMLSRLSHLTFSTCGQDSLDEVKDLLTPYSNEGLIIALRLIEDERWNFRNRFTDLGHW